MINLRGNAMIKWDGDDGFTYYIDSNKKVIRRSYCIYVNGDKCCATSAEYSYAYVGSDTPEWVMRIISDKLIDAIGKYCRKTEKEFGKDWCVDPTITVDKAEGKDRTSYYFLDAQVLIDDILKQNKEIKMRVVDIFNEEHFKALDAKLLVTEKLSKIAMERLDIQMETIRIIDEKVRKLQDRTVALERKTATPVDEFTLPSAREFHEHNCSTPGAHLEFSSNKSFRVTGREDNFSVTFEKSSALHDDYVRRVRFSIPLGMGLNWQYEILKQNKESKVMTVEEFKSAIGYKEPQGIRLDETEHRSKLAITRLDRQEEINDVLKTRIDRFTDANRKEYMNEIKKLQERIEALEEKQPVNTEGYLEFRLPPIDFHIVHSFAFEQTFPNPVGTIIKDDKGNILKVVKPKESFCIYRQDVNFPTCKWEIEIK